MVEYVLVSFITILHQAQAGPGPGRGPGDSSADCRADHGDGDLTPLFPRRRPSKIGVKHLRENKPYTGSFFPSCARANTGKPRKTALFLSCGENAL